ncbi:MAG: hypothetical protein EKK55_01850 [Rhodocyclaceae bacterium]|nr:MAG: hypothetical protein EKK55_01850 [Rhodocyclaceae bacterium]
MQKTPLQIANETLASIAAIPGDEPTGPAHVDHAAVTDLRGVAPSRVGWYTDRGFWAWDGALAAFKAMGIDVDAPLAD